MKTSRFQYKYRKSASKLHRAVGDCLRTGDIFSHHELYQEYPVNRVNTSYKESSHHFDWVIPGLKIVIECHGQQHVKPVAFDGNYEHAIEQFPVLKQRDQAKKVAALTAGYRYIEIYYNEIKMISEEYILNKLGEAEMELEKYISKYQQEVEENDTMATMEDNKRGWKKRKRQEFLSSEKHRKDLEKARDLRRKKYRELKEFRKNE